MKNEIALCSILLLLEATLAFSLPGVAAAAPVAGAFIVIFLATWAASPEAARKARYAFAVFVFLLSAAANMGSGIHVALAVAIGTHYFAWTEGFIGARRFVVKKGEPIPPDGRPIIYTVAFVASILISYLFLDSVAVRLPLAIRGFLAFVAVVCGFCLWDIGYVTRLQPATRFRRPAIPDNIRLMRILVIAAGLTALFLLFGRAIPAAAKSVHEIAYEIRNGAPRLGGDPLRGDRDRAPGTDDWRQSNDAWLHPHKLPSEGDFSSDPSLLVSMRIPDPGQREKLQNSNIYLRGYSMNRFSADQWLKPDAASGKVLLDEADGIKDGRVVVDALTSTSNRPAIVHQVLLLEPFFDVLPALQGVTAYELSLLTALPGDWYASAGSPPDEFTAESCPQIYTQLKAAGGTFVSGDPGTDALAIPDEPIFSQMRQLVANLDGMPVEQCIDRVTELLNERCTYSLKLRNPGNFPPLENFLYGEKKGMCIHYATAATLLLRLADVPARIAFGFSGGEYYQDEGVFAFRARDAHAWTEVFLDGHGWTVVDPTPESQGAAHPPVITNAPDDYLAKLASREAKPNRDTAQEDAVAQGFFMTWFQLFRDLPWVQITMAMLVCIFVTAWFVSARRQMSGSSENGKVLRFAAPEADPRYLRDLYQLCDQRFGIKKVPSETLVEFLTHLKSTCALRNEFDSLSNYHYAVSYEGTARDRQREGELRKEIKAFADVLPRTSS